MKKKKSKVQPKSKPNTKNVKIFMIGTVSSASVEKATGRTWDEWIEILDKRGATMLTHKEIVAFLTKRYRLNKWWQQQVSTGYEIHIGRKLPGRNAKGLYSMTATKTFPINQKAMWELLTSPEGTRLWLKPMSEMVYLPKSPYEVEGGIFGEVRTLKAPMRMRLTWQDSDWEKPTVLQIYVIPRPGEKCLLALQQDGLTTAQLKEQMRGHWHDAMNALLAHIQQDS